MFDLEKAVSEQLESVRGRILENVRGEDGKSTDMWYLRYPDQRAQSTLIIFSPEGIVITGDLCPGDNRGVVSDYGYGLSWFVQELNPYYLAGKFLRKKFVFDVADETFRAMVKDAFDNKEFSVAEEAICEWEEVDPENPIEAVEMCRRHFGEEGCESFGMGYDPKEMKMLVATQRQFAALYAKMRKEAA